MFTLILSYIVEHWVKLLVYVVGFAGSVFGFLFARYTWLNRKFMHKLNFSLNLEDRGVLDFMTIDELDLAVLYDLYPRFRLMLLARRSKKAGRAFVLFQDPKEAWTILNVLLNHLSRLFGAGAIARDLGCATTVEYLFGLTCEVHPELNSFKFRVMLARLELLEKIEATPDFRFELDKHNRIRRQTLLEMLAIQRNPALRHSLQTVKIAVKR